MTKLFFFLFLLTSFESFSQKEKEYRYVPFFKSLSVQSLSNQLTKGYETDEEKIKAIYSWVTNNIKYDVDQWLGFNTQHSSTRHVLFTRKGSAPDFSFLFNELCRYASIPSVVITGYLKNEYTDYGHSYISDDHSWNAVYLNKEWKLYDACLDAGKIEYYKRTFAGYFIYGFTFGTSDRLVYKPHFNREVKLEYFAKSGYEFKADHAPYSTLWQFTSTPYSLKEFEKDSSYLLQTKEYNIKENDSTFNEKRWDYYQKSIEDKQIDQGLEAYKYNPLNDYRKANSLFLIAKKKVIPFEDQEDLSTSNNTKADIDSSNSLLNIADIHVDTNLSQLKQLKISLIEKSKEKKEICKDQYRTLIKSTNTKQKTINSASGIGLSVRIAVKTIEQTNKSLKRKIIRDKTYKKAISAKKTDLQDSLEYAHLKDSCLNEISYNKSLISEKIKHLSEFKVQIIETLDTVHQNTKNNIITQKKVCDLRLQFYDDLDMEIRTIKDSISPIKIYTDSMLLDSIHRNILNAYYKEFTELKKDIGHLYKSQRNYSKYISKYKKSIPSNPILDSTYKKNITSYKKYSIQFDKSLIDIKKDYKTILRKTKNMEEDIKEEKHLFTKEWYIENQLSSIRSFFINKYYKSQVSRSKKLGKDISKLLRKNNKLLRQF